MPATLEEKLTSQPAEEPKAQGMTEEERLAKAIQEFEPPKVYDGEIVDLYLDGDTNCPPRPAMVFRAAGRTLILKGMAPDIWTDVYHGVHHKDDPVLGTRKNLLRNGTWDYHRATKDRMKEIADLKEKMLMVARTLDRKEGTSTAQKLRQEEREAQLRIEALCIKNGILTQRQLKQLSPEEVKQKWEEAGSPE